MSRSRIIAEISSNHLGDLNLAKEHIAAAKEAGADFAKFQSWRAQDLRVSPIWQKDREYYEDTELCDIEHFELFEYCQKVGIQFLTTCFSVDRVNFLSRVSPTIIKIGSIDSTSTALLNACKESFKHIIVSTGMTTSDEVAWLAYTLEGHAFTLMHCVSEYPCDPENLRMSRMNWLRQWCPSIGLSDHSIGINASCIAISRGADFIEKHFILEHNDIAKDSKISILPHELKELCRFRDYVEEADSNTDIEPSDDELATRKKYAGKWGDNK